MTLNSSGPISLGGTTAGQSIAVELGGTGTAQISLNCASVRTLAGVPSGAIVMPTNFYGKSNSFTYTVSTNQTNFCMRAGAVTAGWNGTSALAVNINSGVIISSNATGTPAMTISGSYPAGVTVTNSGTIVGRGGAGGNGGQSKCGGNGGTTAGSAGGAGATAILVSSAVTINNTSGTIAGGGGGGGGGGGAASYCGTYGGGGGGGGGRSSNSTNSSAGNGGATSNGPPYGVSGNAGSAGTYASAGGGGAGGLGHNGTYCYCFTPTGGTGGTGGTWGAAGGTGGGGSCGYDNKSGGSGGSGGKATCGAGTYITWSGTGTRYGSIS